MKIGVLILGLLCIFPLFQAGLPAPTPIAEGPNAGVSQAFSRHPGIRIAKNADFTPSNGVVGGSGTPSDPYIISGWEFTGPAIDNGYISIWDTNASFVVRDVYIHSVYRERSGVWLNNVSNGVIRDIQTTGTLAAVEIWHSRNISLAQNTFEFDGVWIQGDTMDEIRSINISPDNTVNGRPLRFHKDCDGLSLGGVAAGQVIVANCTNVRIANLQLGESISGVQLLFVHNVVVAGSTFRRQMVHGIFAADSSTLTFAGNRISEVGPGRATGSGITVARTADITMTSNVLESNVEGITLFESNRVTIVGNSVASSVGSALYLHDVRGLSVFHNDFVGSATDVVFVETVEAAWDAGYPIGGNFWSSHSNVDRCNGIQQAACGAGDGIADAAYEVRSGQESVGIDRYPLAQSHLSANLPPMVPASHLLVAEISAIGLSVVAAVFGFLYFRRRREARRSDRGERPQGDEATVSDWPGQNNR